MINTKSELFDRYLKSKGSRVPQKSLPFSKEVFDAGYDAAVSAQKEELSYESKDWKRIVELKDEQLATVTRERDELVKLLREASNRLYTYSQDNHHSIVNELHKTISSQKEEIERLRK